MSTLHIIRYSAFNHREIENCLSVVDANDAVVYMDDGVYNINHASHRQLSDKLTAEHIYLIAPHAVARGLKVSKEVNLIDMADLLALSVNHTQSITWQ